MIDYKSRSGKVSSVTGYELGSDFIKVRFKDEKKGDVIYCYTIQSTGSHYTIEEMKRHAIMSSGLCTFINKNKPGYVK